jgi:hypothetical protein
LSVSPAAPDLTLIKNTVQSGSFRNDWAADCLWARDPGEANAWKKDWKKHRKTN